MFIQYSTPATETKRRELPFLASPLISFCSFVDVKSGIHHRKLTILYLSYNMHRYLNYIRVNDPIDFMRAKIQESSAVMNSRGIILQSHRTPERKRQKHKAAYNKDEPPDHNFIPDGLDE
jgi:hypothetical protein